MPDVAFGDATKGHGGARAKVRSAVDEAEARPELVALPCGRLNRGRERPTTVTQAWRGDSDAVGCRVPHGATAGGPAHLDTYVDSPRGRDRGRHGETSAAGHAAARRPRSICRSWPNFCVTVCSNERAGAGDATMMTLLGTERNSWDAVGVGFMTSINVSSDPKTSTSMFQNRHECVVIGSFSGILTLLGTNDPTNDFLFFHVSSSSHRLSHKSPSAPRPNRYRSVLPQELQHESTVGPDWGS